MTDDRQKPHIFDMLSSFFGPQYRDWWLSHVKNPDAMSPYRNHWLVRQSAAEAFASGHLRLERLQPSMIEPSGYPTSLPSSVDTSYPNFVTVQGQSCEHRDRAAYRCRRRLPTTRGPLTIRNRVGRSAVYWHSCPALCEHSIRQPGQRNRGTESAPIAAFPALASPVFQFTASITTSETFVFMGLLYECLPCSVAHGADKTQACHLQCRATAGGVLIRKAKRLLYRTETSIWPLLEVSRGARCVSERV